MCFVLYICQCISLCLDVSPKTRVANIVFSCILMFRRFLEQRQSVTYILLADRAPWEELLEWQSNPGRLDIVQEGNFKGAEVGYLPVPKDEPVGKIGLTEQGVCLGLRKKREFMAFGRRGRQLRRTTRMS